MNRLVWVVLLLSVIDEGQSSDQVTTQGAGGRPCGDMGKKCLAGQALCLEDKCVCQPEDDLWGDGDFRCYELDEIGTEVKNDPFILNWNRERFELPIPCRFYMTHYKTNLLDSSGKIKGTCELSVHVFNEKCKGKFFAAGFEAAVKMRYNSGSVSALTFRMAGTAENGVYWYDESGNSNKYLENGPYTDNGVTITEFNHDITISFDQINNVATIAFKRCGTKITFRAYDCEQRINQDQIPGVSVSVEKCFLPVFLSPDHVISVGHHSFKGGDLNNNVVYGNLNWDKFFTYRALINQSLQNEPDEAGECYDSQFYFGECDMSKPLTSDPSKNELQVAIDNCYWILDEPRFVRCIDDTTHGEPTMTLFNTCIDYFCSNYWEYDFYKTKNSPKAENYRCDFLRAFIKDTHEECQKVTGIPQLRAIMKGQIC